MGTTNEALAMYVRVPLIGASGIRLAEALADDPWTDGAIANLPRELAQAIRRVV
ncbi:hypothetical protein [Gordonia sp. VNK21]|uniref:hypothetical protein n=1 Tax=Gordonia sp. VNK21 TaxID=3382483 RepID=UPI0038D3FEE3